MWILNLYKISIKSQKIKIINGRYFKKTMAECATVRVPAFTAHLGLKTRLRIMGMSDDRRDRDEVPRDPECSLKV